MPVRHINRDGWASRPSAFGEFVRDARGSQLAELAIVLPILLLLIAGISDFGEAFNLKQKLSNAAREAARFGSSESTLDLYQGGTPPSIQAIRDVVQNYLTDAGLSACAIDTGPTQVNLRWTYTSGACGNFSLVIDRGYTTTAADGVTIVTSTHVVLTYPYTWYMAQIFGPGQAARFPRTITTDAVMQNAL